MRWQVFKQLVITHRWALIITEIAACFTMGIPAYALKYEHLYHRDPFTSGLSLGNLAWSFYDGLVCNFALILMMVIAVKFWQHRPRWKDYQ